MSELPSLETLRFVLEGAEAASPALRTRYAAVLRGMLAGYDTELGAIETRLAAVEERIVAETQEGPVLLERPNGEAENKGDQKRRRAEPPRGAA